MFYLHEKHAQIDLSRTPDQALQPLSYHRHLRPVTSRAHHRPQSPQLRERLPCRVGDRTTATVGRILKENGCPESREARRVEEDIRRGVQEVRRVSVRRSRGRAPGSAQAASRGGPIRSGGASPTIRSPFDWRRQPRPTRRTDHTGSTLLSRRAEMACFWLTAVSLPDSLST